jgi:DNA-binding NarL/FixJ family response regulator
MSERKIRILIADDQRLFADNLKAVIEARAEDMTIVGIANDGTEAIRLAREQWPDIILMDVCMPLLDGVKAIRAIKSELPKIRILVLTTFGDDDYVLEALKYGAIGYLLKDISMPELIQTIRSVSTGNVMMSPEIANTLLKNYTQRNPAQPPAPAVPEEPEWFVVLNKRERQILSLIGEGCNNYEIGSKLCIGEQTVKNYVSNIYEKSGIHDRLLVIKEAVRLRPLLEKK